MPHPSSSNIFVSSQHLDRKFTSYQVQNKIKMICCCFIFSSQKCLCWINEMETTTRVCWQRWWILTLFSLFTMWQCAIWNTWGPVAETAIQVWFFKVELQQHIKYWSNHRHLAGQKERWHCSICGASSHSSSPVQSRHTCSQLISDSLLFSPHSALLQDPLSGTES